MKFEDDLSVDTCTPALIDALCKRAVKISDANGWRESIAGLETPIAKGLKISLLAEEVGELSQATRKPAPGEIEGFSNEELELADIVIRSFEHAELFGLNLGDAIVAKMFYNSGRPRKHGGKPY